MKPFLRTGHVVWYDARRGYGFVHDHTSDEPVYITHTELERFGITGLSKGQEILFKVGEGVASEKVHSIKQMVGANRLH